MLNNVDDKSTLGDSAYMQLGDENEENIDSFSFNSLELASEDDDPNACNANENISLESEFGEWESKRKLPREAPNQLLDILRRQGHRLPKDCRTRMRTPR